MSIPVPFGVGTLQSKTPYTLLAFETPVLMLPWITNPVPAASPEISDNGVSPEIAVIEVDRFYV